MRVSPRRRNAIEIAQVWCRLALFGWHQKAIGTDHVIFPADQDMWIVLGAIDKIPKRFCLASIDATDCPRVSERAVGDRRLDAQQAQVYFVKCDPLANNGGIIFVQRHPTAFVGAGTLEATRLDLKQIVATVAILVDPLADRV